ncbi:four helix bundle protein [Chryseobacterium sp. PTM-20240506]|uniref:four helix bundle protein n=2 Tax=Chryseobacterium TaxID=59732 RepID=UPI001552D83C|nr:MULTISPECIES: four helix bundle protein [unclassified Chryseobacterium]MDC8106568.1 four helix bundle protein [Chryseobacterium sp. B21-037]MDQ1806531.1 four helix bundle protein [Chryseobacterium sp. CKR4-1]WBV55784.1 four helix bundle protein [Chryseobacterium daecheongense]
MRDDKENIIVNKTFDFALNIIEFSEELYKANRFPLANQIFKSGTSIGANVREAQNAESKADFIHKLKIAAKEAEETEYWLLLCSQSQYLKSPDEKIRSDLKEIVLILSKIISSSKA